MFGLLGWLFYTGFAGSRLIARLSRKPLKLDVLDPAPLMPVARWSLGTALMFVGGISLSMVFISSSRESFPWLEWGTIIIYVVLILVTVLLFFLSMWGVHTAMAEAKRRELALARKHLSTAFMGLRSRAVQGQSEGMDGLSVAVAGWTAYEARIARAPEWPYNAGIIRRLAASVLAPIAVYLIKILTALGLRFGQ